MLSLFNPIISAPTSNSPSWYKEFHSGFYLSQITNSMLLAGLDGMCIAESGQADAELSYDQMAVIGADVMVNKVIAALHQHSHRTKAKLTAMGLEVEDTQKVIVNIDKNNLLSQTGKPNWFEGVKGFLNLWEFLFLFSITESTLKSVLEISLEGMDGALNAVLRANPDFSKRLLTKYCIDRNLCVEFWTIFVRIRNICSHSHGYLTLEDVERVRESSEKFNISFRKYLRRLGNENPINSFMMDRDEGYFPAEEFVVGRFYLIKDSELNLFRNFIAIFMYELQLRHSEKD